MEIDKVQEIIERWEKREDLTIEMLHDVQSEFNYLPEDALSQISEEVGVPISTLYSVATFYRAFSLTPRGRHMISVCMGTPCHALGAPIVVEALERQLNVKCGGTTDDMNFTLETTGCVGTCGLAPVIIVDDELYGPVNPAKVSKLVDKYKNQK